MIEETSVNGAPRILAVYEDRTSAAIQAQALNRAGLMFRYVTDRRKMLGGLRQLRPDLLYVDAEVRSELTADVLAALAEEVTFAALPIVLLCNDVSDAPFLKGLRSGIVGVLQKPFSAERHTAQIRLLLADLPTRTGQVLGQGDSRQLAQLVEHLRRTSRTGLLTLGSREPHEGKAAWVRGKLESASFRGLEKVEALVAMVAQPSAAWSFSEVGGGQGSGAGVVLEIGGAQAADEEEVPIERGPPPAPADAYEVEEQVVTVPATVPDEIVREPTPLLLVDDDPALCTMFSRMFDKRGFAVTTAPDGVEGYGRARQGSYEVVIADLNMPRMDGWGLLRLLRDDFHTRELPVAFLSCHDDYRESLRALNAGAQAYFSKGTRLEALVQQIRALLKPRFEVRLQLAAGQQRPLQLGRLGPQWLLATLSRLGVSGRLEAKDAWAHYSVFFREGRAMHAIASTGRHTAEGERALNALVASTDATGTFSFGSTPVPATLLLPTQEQLARTCDTLNDNEQKLRDSQLAQAKSVQVNSELYAVYRQVGPSQWLDLARLICEERLPPREIIARADASPIEVEATLKDLIRRGVVSLQ